MVFKTELGGPTLWSNSKSRSLNSTCHAPRGGGLHSPGMHSERQKGQMARGSVHDATYVEQRTSPGGRKQTSPGGNLAFDSSVTVEATCLL